MKKNKRLLILGLIFIFFLIIGYLIPYTHDDWAWGSKIGIERLNTLFKNYNGRYFSNLLILLLTRSRVLAMFVFSFGLTSILYLINKYVDESKNKFYFILVFTLFLLIPRSIFAQGVIWYSGYVNYTISFLPIIIFLIYNKDIFKNKINNKWYLIMFILGFISSLFVEHLTIYSVIVSLFFIIYQKIKIKKVSIGNVLYFIGSLLGSIMMFSNGAYIKVLNHTDFYRKVASDNIIISSIKSYVGSISDNLIIKNLFLNIFIFILIILCFNSLRKNKSNKFKFDFKVKILLLIQSVFVFSSCFRYLFLRSYNNVYLKLFFAFFGGLYFLTLLFFTYKYISDKEIKSKMLFVLISIIVISGPILFVKPIGSRIFVPTYFLFIIYSVLLYKHIFKEQNLHFEKCLSFICICLSSLYLIIYIPIGYIDKLTIRYINTNNFDKESIILLPDFPNKRNVYFFAIKNKKIKELFKKRYKLFYDIPLDKEIEFIPYKKWKKVKK